MIDEDEVREMLSRRADSVPVLPLDTPTAVGRARRRLLVNGAVTAVTAVVIAVTVFAGAHALRGAPVPAHPTPSGAAHVQRVNGEVLSFTGTWTPRAEEAMHDGVPIPTPGDLVAVNPETGAKRVLLEGVDSVVSAAWSNDGRWIAYEVAVPGGSELWVLGATDGPRQVAEGSLLWMWSSTGAELATVRLTSQSSLGRNLAGATFSTIDPVSGETVDSGSISKHIGDVTSAPAWSPDRTRFVVGARGGAVYLVDARSGAGSLLVRLPGKHLDSVDRILWSPDGAHIAVMNDLDPGDGRLYVMDADGANVRVVVDQYADWGVAWSPDGTRLAYRDGPGSVSVASMDGSAPVEIGSPLPTSCDMFCEGGELVWSPDGSLIGSRNAGDATVVSAINANGRGEPERIDEPTYRSWEGGSYSCGCY